MFNPWPLQLKFMLQTGSQRLKNFYKFSIIPVCQSVALVPVVESSSEISYFFPCHCSFPLFSPQEYVFFSKEFSRKFVNGAWDGFWWAVVTMTTVG